MNVLFEATLVGLFLIPIYLISERLFTGYGKWFVIFMAGALFHLIAEITGINRAYIMTKK